ncbi:MAG: protein kinase [Mycobacterium sp.]
MDEVAFGRYRLIELIGQGGMGTVYKAHDTVMRRDVAIKVLPPELVTEPGYADRFRREAYMAAKLTEPHIIPIHDAGEIDGQLYLVMPVIKGTDLHTLLRRDGPMTPRLAVQVVEQIGAALDAAHAADLVHRDVKPSNALMTANEFVYLIDFGIAHEAKASRLTRTGNIVGSWAYMAPERFSTGTGDARADVYALACVLYECLTGQLPYPGDSLQEQISGHLTTDAPKPSVFDPAILVGFDDVIARGMAKHPEQRYQTAHQLAAAARRALSGAPTPAAAGPAPVPTIIDGPGDPTLTESQRANALASAASRQSAELKQVTVLFAGVVDSMDLAAAVGVERFHEIMTELVNRSAVVVQRYGGMVDKFTGEGFMAVFGAPAALEDHSLRACLAALGIQQEAKSLAGEVECHEGGDLRLRIGLNSGQVIAGGIGSGSLGLVGEQAGMAQRMESAAAPGGVMLSASSARLVETTAVLGEPELVQIDGAHAPVPARRLLGVASQPGGIGRFETTLVGRQWEMSIFTGVLDRVVGGHGSVVCVGGPPGIGKSRLVHEAAEIARGRGVEVFSTFCESHAGDISFHVVARLLRAIAGISDLDGEAARARVRDQVPDGVDPQDLVLLDDLLGIRDPDTELPPIDPAARRRRLTALINAVSLARTAPVIYILEDAHWIDAVSESMLAEFLKVIPKTPSMALITYRPYYHGALAQVPGAQTVALDPLDDADISTLVGELLGADPSVGAVKALITERTAGNPFFAEEMVRELAERGVLEGERGRYLCRTDVAEVSVPATVQAVIAARIDRLEPGAKQTLSAAAVIGSQFGPDLLTSLGIDPALEALVEAEMIDQVRFAPRAEYAFRHPLIRAVAYESQLKSDRAKLHRRLAAAIEAGDPGSVEENAALIAENLEAAGDVQLAYGWHMRAGGCSTHRDMAAARLSWERAREIADALAPDDPERTVMRIAPRTLLCGTAYRVHADSSARFEELRDLSTLAGDKASLAMGMAGQVMDRWVHARVREASALASELMALVEAIADPDMTVGLSGMPTIVKIETGEYSDVLRWSQTVIDLADGDPIKGNFILGSPLAFAHATRAVGRAALGHPLAEVLPALPVAAAMARETDPTTHAMVIAFTYALGISVGALLADDAALELIDEALQIAERSADDFALGHARYALGLALMHRDSPADRERGLQVLTQLRDMCLHEHWTLSEVPFIDAYVAWEQARRGDLDGAIAALRVAVDDLFDAGQLAWCIPPTRVFVETLLARGGEADLQEAQTAIERLAAAPIEVADRDIWVLRLRALLAGARGDEAAHRHLLKQHRAMATKLGRLGHMAMSDSWTMRAAAAGASRMVSASARMSRKPGWNRLIRWSAAPKRRR